nr:AIPR family protein [uncultured Pantoea sp.]
MINEQFYDYIDHELQAIIDSEVYSPYFVNLKQIEQKKSYAFLIWFLNSYGRISNVEDYITDGHDDYSCDIILDKVDSQGEKIFYLVQSKWNTKKNCNSEFDNKDLKSFLSDVQSVIKGDKAEGANEKFNRQYQHLKEHVKRNGKIKIIYLCLKNNCNDSNENIKSLKDIIGGQLEIEGFDINRLKIDYISQEYRKSIPPNPLENIYSPDLEKITMEVIRDGSSNIEIKDPFPAHVFLVRPKLIFELVSKYGVSLFDRNVRDPIASSNINEEIKSTLLKNPSYFWYYNNGITAITRRIPKLNSQAEQFDILGLQIINGAQTANSIYNAYKNCNQAEREILDEEAKVTFRLLKSGGDDFDLKVTKYTNSQNPVSERDFWSNDPIQQKLQNYFFNTSIWYEKREGEFRDHPEDIYVVQNRMFACSYFSFWLNSPVELLKSLVKIRGGDIDLLFTSRVENKDGLYERIFNDNTKPQDVHSSFIMFALIAELPAYRRRGREILYTNCFHILNITKIVCEKYLKLKYGKDAKVSPFIIKNEDENEDLLKRIVAYSAEKLQAEVSSIEEDERKRYIFGMMSKNSYLDMFLEKLKNEPMTVEDIEEFSLEIYEEDEDDDDDDEKEYDYFDDEDEDEDEDTSTFSS